MVAIVFMLAQEAAVVPPKVVDAVTISASAPFPLNNPGSWVTTADYPLSSLRAHEEGATGFALTVGTLGEVIDCKIVSSSGSEGLDRATCYLVSQRARFKAATGADGKPVTGTYNSRVRWNIPRLPGPTATQMVISFHVDADGIVSDCKFEQRTGAALKLPDDKVPGCLNGAHYQPYRNDNGEPVAKQIRVHQEVEEIPAAK